MVRCYLLPGTLLCNDGITGVRGARSRRKQLGEKWLSHLLLYLGKHAWSAHQYRAALDDSAHGSNLAARLNSVYSAQTYLLALVLALFRYRLGIYLLHCLLNGGNSMNGSDRPQEKTPETLKLYVIGFLLSIALTLCAFVIVGKHLLIGGVLVGVVLGLGFLQVLVQLLFFLHLGRESRPRWNLMVFLFMALVVIIIAGGSIWIMQNLNYRMGMG